MKKVNSISEILEAAEKLSPDEKEMIIDIKYILELLVSDLAEQLNGDKFLNGAQ